MPKTITQYLGDTKISSSGSSGLEVTHIPLDIFSLSNESTHQEVSDIIGGVDGFHKISQAIINGGVVVFLDDRGNLLSTQSAVADEVFFGIECMQNNFLQNTSIMYDKDTGMLSCPRGSEFTELALRSQTSIVNFDSNIDNLTDASTSLDISNAVSGEEGFDRIIKAMQNRSRVIIWNNGAINVDYEVTDDSFKLIYSGKTVKITNTNGTFACKVEVPQTPGTPVIWHPLDNMLLNISTSISSGELSLYLGGQAGWNAIKQALADGKGFAFKSGAPTNLNVITFLSLSGSSLNINADVGGTEFTIHIENLSDGVFQCIEFKYKNSASSEQLLAESTLRIESDEAINEKIDIINEASEIQPTIKLYVGSNTGLSTTEPTVPVTIPLNITGNTTPTVHKLTYKYTEPGIISYLSTFSLDLYTSSIETDKQYNFIVKVNAIVGGVVTNISESNYSNRYYVSNPVITIPLNGNKLPATGLKRDVGDSLEVEISITKSGGGSDSMNILSSANNPSTLTRNGGEVSTTNVYDYNGTNLKTASDRFRDLEARIPAGDSLSLMDTALFAENAPAVVVKNDVDKTISITYDLTLKEGLQANITVVKDIYPLPYAQNAENDISLPAVEGFVIVIFSDKSGTGAHYNNLVLFGNSATPVSPGNRITGTITYPYSLPLNETSPVIKYDEESNESIKKIWSGSLAEYEALTNIEFNTLYAVRRDGTTYELNIGGMPVKDKNSLSTPIVVTYGDLSPIVSKVVPGRSYKMMDNISGMTINDVEISEIESIIWAKTGSTVDASGFVIKVGANPIKWVGGAPTIKPNTFYVISILNGVAAIGEY